MSRQEVTCDKKDWVASCMSQQRALWTGFVNSVNRFPTRPAVWVEGKSVSYAQLKELASRIAAIPRVLEEFIDCSVCL
jgi:hypothetical protein